MGNVAVEPPRDPAHGDMATNAAMVLAKPAGMKPRDIAAALAGKLAEDARIDSAEVAGPGLSEPAAVGGDMARRDPLGADEGGAAYGRSDMGQGRRSTSNMSLPTRPGRFMSATRAARCSAMRWRAAGFAGHDVTREYYINDGGAQVDVLARSVYLRYLEAHGQEVAFEDGTYPGDYLIAVGEALKDKVGDAYIGKPEARVAGPGARFRHRGDDGR